ncbi:chromosome partitioning protein ParB [Verrucomicrobia bacterium LW23]|nr:chromosome partitioning protein ParB [Verrucomicrobia bacterium LW23]
MSTDTIPASPTHAATPKPKALANGIEVWCAFDELVPTGDLKPNPRNPNKHPEGQIALLVKAIRYFGWRHTILVSRRSGLIVAGHGRLLAAQSLGVSLVPVDFQDFASDADEMAVLVGDNRLAELAETDDDEIAAILKELDGQIDLDLTGFDASEVEKLLPPEDNVTDSPVPALPDEAFTRPGDIYVLGNHRLMCGDSSKPDQLDQLLAGSRIQMVNTDPPYNVKVEPRSNNAIAAGMCTDSPLMSPNAKKAMHHQQLDVERHPEKAKATHKKLRAKDRPLANDFVSVEEFDRLLRAWFGNIARVLEPGRCFYIWGGYANLVNYPSALAEKELYFSQAIIWDKEHPVLTRKDFMGAFEIAFYGWREGAAHQYFGPNNATDLWHVKKVNPQSMVHLTEKPVELAVRAMGYSSRPGESVMDLFGGSGSSLIGAEQCGRKAFLMELDPLYCDVIVTRWIQLGEGRTAKVIRNGSTTDVTDCFLRRAAENEAGDEVDLATEE